MLFGASSADSHSAAPVTNEECSLSVIRACLARSERFLDSHSPIGACNFWETSMAEGVRVFSLVFQEGRRTLFVEALSRVDSLRVAKKDW